MLPWPSTALPPFAAAAALLLTNLLPLPMAFLLSHSHAGTTFALLRRRPFRLLYPARATRTRPPRKRPWRSDDAVMHNIRSPAGNRAKQAHRHRKPKSTAPTSQEMAAADEAGRAPEHFAAQGAACKSPRSPDAPARHPVDWRTGCQVGPADELCPVLALLAAILLACGQLVVGSQCRLVGETKGTGGAELREVGDWRARLGGVVWEAHSSAAACEPV